MGPSVRRAAPDAQDHLREDRDARLHDRGAELEVFRRELEAQHVLREGLAAPPDQEIAKML